MAKLRAFLAGTTFLVLIAAGPATAGTFPPFPPGNCAAGNCWGTSAGDTITGTPDGQGLHGLGGNDLIRGLAGNDFLTGDAADDAVYGGSGRDTVDGDEGDDRVGGGSGPDKVNGGTGSDMVVGNKGDDRLSGGGGRDHIDGQDLGTGGIGVATSRLRSRIRHVRGGLRRHGHAQLRERSGRRILGGGVTRMVAMETLLPTRARRGQSGNDGPTTRREDHPLKQDIGVPKDAFGEQWRVRCQNPYHLGG